MSLLIETGASALAEKFLERAAQAECVARALRATGYLDLSRIECDFVEGAAVLRGELGWYYLKQIAQTVAAKVPGVRRVENHIRVREPE